MVNIGEMFTTQMEREGMNLVQRMFPARRRVARLLVMMFDICGDERCGRRFLETFIMDKTSGDSCFSMVMGSSKGGKNDSFCSGDQPDSLSTSEIDGESWEKTESALNSWPMPTAQRRMLVMKGRNRVRKGNTNVKQAPLAGN